MTATSADGRIETARLVRALESVHDDTDHEVVMARIAAARTDLHAAASDLRSRDDDEARAALDALSPILDTLHDVDLDLPRPTLRVRVHGDEVVMTPLSSDEPEFPVYATFGWSLVAVLTVAAVASIVWCAASPGALPVAVAVTTLLLDLCAVGANSAASVSVEIDESASRSVSLAYLARLVGPDAVRDWSTPGLVEFAWDVSGLGSHASDDDIAADLDRRASDIRSFHDHVSPADARAAVYRARHGLTP